MRFFLKLFFSLSLLVALQSLNAQATQPEKQEMKSDKKKKHFDPSNAVLFVPNYTAQFPFGDMKNRFGFNSLFGMQLLFKVKKNWLIGVDGAFLFGTRVKQNYLANGIATSTGQFITQDNQLINVSPQEYGGNVKFNVGKIIPFSEKYPDAGLLLITGFGFLQHKIMWDVKEKNVPQLSKVYRKGYDRLSNGPALSQFIGGIFLQRRKFISMYAGLQFDVGFTENRRNYDFYLQQKLSEKRIDMFLGIKVGWIIPVFLQTSEKEFFYY